MFLLILVVIASIGRTNAQDFQGIFDFLTTFDFDSLFATLCPAVTPFFDSFGIDIPFCSGDGGTDDGTDDGTANPPAAAPTKKGKVTTGTAAPVAPPSTTP
jgi:hypothetical protein